MDILLNLCFILALVGLNAFFVAAEFAMVGTRPTRLQTLAEAGDRKARLALTALAFLDDYISGTQLGITLASLALGWIGERTLATLVIYLFAGLPAPFGALATHTVASTLAFAGITFFFFFLGELTPKSLALLHPEHVSRWVVRPLMVFTAVFWPAIWLLNKSASAFLQLLSIPAPAYAERVHAPEELLMLLSESRKYGLVEEADARMIAGVFDLSHTMVRKAMTPRTEIEAIERGWTRDKIIDVVRQSGYSRLPVYTGDPDHIVGIFLVKDFLTCEDPSTFDLEKVMREPFFIPATMRVDVLMKALRQRSAHMAIVVDEYGGTLGLVTLEDLIEEIVGEIFDEFDEAETDSAVQATAEGHLSIPGDMPLEELNARYHLHFPEGEYVTVAGFVLSVLEHIPAVGEQIQVEDVTLQVTAMDNLRIERLEVTLPPRPSEATPLPPDPAT